MASQPSPSDQPATTGEGPGVYEVTFPAPPPGSQPGPDPGPKPAGNSRAVLAATGAVVLLALVSFSAYAFGYVQGRSHAGLTGTQSVSPVKVPEGATIISQCAVGRGTQYVLPSNIPHGPVFNVYQGKVIGLEYMIGSDDLAGSMSFYNLPLYGQKYDHIDVGLMSEGHAGYPERHYHVDVYNVSRATSEAITCK